MPDIRLEPSLAKQPLPVRADIAQLERVLPNLAVNARDAMPEGGIPAVETSPVTLDGAYSERKIDVEPGEYAMMSVSDSGHGMDEALRGLPDKVAAVLGKEKV